MNNWLIITKDGKSTYVMAYNVMDAIRLWGEDNGGYYGEILSVEKRGF